MFHISSSWPLWRSSSWFASRSQAPPGTCPLLPQHSRKLIKAKRVKGKDKVREMRYAAF